MRYRSKHFILWAPLSFLLLGFPVFAGSGPAGSNNSSDHAGRQNAVVRVAQRERHGGRQYGRRFGERQYGRRFGERQYGRRFGERQYGRRFGYPPGYWNWGYYGRGYYPYGYYGTPYYFNPYYPYYDAPYYYYNAPYGYFGYGPYGGISGGFVWR